MRKAIYFESSFSASDKIKHYMQGWKPDDNPKAIICLIHGIGEHTGRYDQWAERFSEEGYIFVGFDLRGHGKSEGKRGHFNSIGKLFSDMNIFIKKIKIMFPGIPLILYGHSMGGNIALNYLMNYQGVFKAAIISSPWLRLTSNPSSAAIFMAKVVKSIFPSLLQNTGLNVSNISKDKDEVKRYAENKYIHNKISVSAFVEMSNSADWIMSNPLLLKTPIIMIHGEEDKITSHLATMEFANKSKSFSRIKIFKGLFHETHHEPEQDDVFNYLINELQSIQLSV